MWKQRAIDKVKSHTITLAEFDLSKSSAAKFQDVTSTVFYWEKKPYKLLGHPGTSSIEMQFSLGPWDMPKGYKKKDIISIDIVLNHCRTSDNGIIDVLLNGKFLIEEYKDACDPFGEQTFNYPIQKFKEGQNALKIQLSLKSPSVYWIADAKIVAHVDPKAVKD